MTIGKEKKDLIKNNSVSLVVPVYGGEMIVINQLKQCKAILQSFTKKYEIITADDKSKDATASLLKKNFENDKNFNLIFNKKNIGIAANIKKLYSHSRYSYVCLYSADGDWNPTDIKRLVNKSYRENFDIVIGKRDKSVYNPYRRLISFIYNFLPVILFRVNTIDASSIKVIKKTLFNKIKIVSESVFFEAEFIIKAKNKGYSISSIPVSFERKREKKKNPGKTKLAIISLIDLIKLRFNN